MPITVVIENFRSIAKTQIDLQPGVNILVGSNGSGKTNILSALKFLRDLFKEGAGLALAKNGGSVRNYRRGENVISFSISHDYGMRVYNRKKIPHVLNWSVSIAQSGPEKIATVTKESMSISALSNDETINVFSIDINRNTYNRPKAILKTAPSSALGRDLFSTVENASNQSKEHLYSDFKGRLERLLDHIKKQNDQAIFPELAAVDQTLNDILSRFLNLNEYNILPDIARQSTDQLPFAEISSNGAGLGEVIYALEKKNYHRLLSSQDHAYSSGRMLMYMRHSSDYLHYRYSPSYFYSQRGRGRVLDGLLDRINEELSRAVRSVESVTTQVDPTNGKRFVIFHSGKHTFYPEEVSDGTIKWLSILVSIFLPFTNTYLLEEPENFLHPWMQQQLIRIMREQASANSTMFLITSHSATILNAAVPEEITVVTRNHGGTEACRLEGKEEINILLQESEFGLGDLWVSGLIGGIPEGDQ